MGGGREGKEEKAERKVTVHVLVGRSKVLYN